MLFIFGVGKSIYYRLSLRTKIIIRNTAWITPKWAEIKNMEPRGLAGRSCVGWLFRDVKMNCSKLDLRRSIETAGGIMVRGIHLHLHPSHIMLIIFEL